MNDTPTRRDRGRARNIHCTREDRSCLGAAGPRELAGLEALLAEDRTPLRRPEGHRRFLAAGGTVGDGLDPFAGHAGAPASRPAGPLGFAPLAPLRLVLEV